MKKLSKLLALLLSLLMILSLFAACGDDKKDDDEEETSVSDEKDKDDEDEDEDEDKDDKKDKNNKKDDEDEDEDEDDSASAEDMLIGEWEGDFDIDDGIYVNLSLIFEDDGTAYFNLSKTSYDNMIDEIIASELDGVTDEDIEAEGFASREEAEEYVREMIEAEVPYEDMAAQFEASFTWELYDDTLTIENENGSNFTAETKLSKGKTTFTLIKETDETEIKFTKVN